MSRQFQQTSLPREVKNGVTPQSGLGVEFSVAHVKKIDGKAYPGEYRCNKVRIETMVTDIIAEAQTLYPNTEFLEVTYTNSILDDKIDMLKERLGTGYVITRGEPSENRSVLFIDRI